MLTMPHVKVAVPLRDKVLKNVAVHEGDLPEDVYQDAVRAGFVAWDLETSGLNWSQHKICLCQISIPNESIHVIRMGDSLPERLRSIIDSAAVIKLFHHAMFDLRFIVHHWAALPQNVSCTKISSKILHPGGTDHSLKHLLERYLDISVDKSLQTSDWLAPVLSKQQLRYAARDVLYLPTLFDRLRSELQATGRWPLAQASFEYVPARVKLDLLGSEDVFRY